MTAKQLKQRHKAIPFRNATEVLVTFEDGGTEKGIIKFIPEFFAPFYYDEEDNQDGWEIKYPEWFMGGVDSHLTEYTHLGEFRKVKGGWEAEDCTYGKITFRLA
jgi:hypothetical protein